MNATERLERVSRFYMQLNDTPSFISKLDDFEKALARILQDEMFGVLKELRLQEIASKTKK